MSLFLMIHYPFQLVIQGPFKSFLTHSMQKQSLQPSDLPWEERPLVLFNSQVLSCPVKNSNYLATEKKKKRRLFECTPCHTVYKTRAKWTHHTNICPHHKKRHSLSVTVQCVCGSEGDGNMIECTQCHTWLHVKCAGDRVTKEDCYCCPRCSTDETEPVNDSEDELLVEDEDMISLSALYSAKERGKNLLESLKQVQEKDAQQEQERMNRNHLNFMSLFDEPQLEIQDQEEEFQSLSLPPSSIFEDQEWNVHEFDWCQPEDVPSLLFSSDDTPSNIDEVPFSPIQQQPDWFDFANFEVDFTSDI
ncbi:uncharacterized protein B0P05DRAFT_542197 [Gilbertella persicaria]|uniref:uncharacterized protein n=1 Tax=Gilbertella persicaria TaxID=101096 RepID=UPI00221FB3DD|nr:uncharacterized protein B0P05DRAFT_542197 [Gilbertella persicaria]KAI8079060.1 hypothetical protein B0P05DRAFT_542197 [Gilbertella persicaria]